MAEWMSEVLKAQSPGMIKNLRSDLAIIRERDPAARGPLEIVLCYPGYQALTAHRLSHRIWKSKLPLKLVARLLSQVFRCITGIEIHPGARIGQGVFIDHGMGVVIGETAEIGDRCLLYQGVTLGGTGKENGKRHPTLANDVVIGAGAKILGAIEIGANTRVGAGSVVVRNVEANCTVVGVPGRVIHQSGVKINPLAHSALPDAEANVIRNLMERIDQLEARIRHINSALDDKQNARNLAEDEIPEAQNLKDREILEYLGNQEDEDASSEVKL